MKEFVVSIVLFIFIVGISITNMVYIDSVTDKLSEMVAVLPRDKVCETSEVKEIYDYWLANVKTIQVGTKTIYTRAVTEKLLMLISSTQTGNFYDYTNSVNLLDDAISMLEEIEKLYIENIL